MDVIDTKIAECNKRLAAVARQIDDLKQEAASIEGELRAYRFVKGAATDAPKKIFRGKFRDSSMPVAGPTTAVSAPEIEVVTFSRLSPVWQQLFKTMVASYPKHFSDAELREIAKAAGFEIGDSFRTSLWHHAQRGALTKNHSDGTYVANQITAEKAGIRWPGS